MTLKPFMTTTWSHLAMLNYEIDPHVLKPFIPRHTELDEFNGRCFVSMVGFQFSGTKIFGIGMPGYSNFCEVNLRSYVRYRADDGWRRGVIFIKEIVARRAVAFVARTLYDEHFETRPMRYSIEPHRARYEWKVGTEWNHLALTTDGSFTLPMPGSEEEFIAEHYWGYTARRDGSTSEYCVKHPPWHVSEAVHAEFECNVAKVYGSPFMEALTAEPSSTFLAKGSPVVVYRGNRLAEPSFKPVARHYDRTLPTAAIK